MPRNVDIKDRVDLAAVQSLVEPVVYHGPVEFRQSDTFFSCSYGRLKVREVADGAAITHRLMKTLHIQGDQLIEGTYSERVPHCSLRAELDGNGFKETEA